MQTVPLPTLLILLSATCEDLGCGCLQLFHFIILVQRKGFLIVLYFYV